MNNAIASRLADLGLELPDVGTPRWNYIPMQISGKLVFVSGQTPKRNGTAIFTGRCGGELDVSQGYEAAHLCGLNALGILESVGLESIRRIVKINGYVASADGFVEQGRVIDGTSNLITTVLGDAGQHTRTSVGVSWLPENVPVEVELIAELF